MRVLLYFLPFIPFVLCFGVFRKNAKAFFAGVLISVFLIAANFKFDQYDDLYRYFDFYTLFRNKGLVAFNSSVWAQEHFNGTYLIQLFMYVLSFFPDYLVKGIPPTLIYFFTGKTISLILEKQGKTQLFSVIFLFISLSINLYSAISSWHYLLSCAILAYFMALELSQKSKKFICYAGYIALCFAHSICVTLFLFKLLYLLVKKSKFLKYWIPVLFILWRLLVNWIASILGLYRNNIYASYLLSKVNYYGVVNENESLQLFYLISLILILLYSIVQVYLNRGDEENFSIGFVILCSSFMALGSIESLNIVFRYTYFVLMLMPAYFTNESVDLIPYTVTKYTRKGALLLCMCAFSCLALGCTQYYVFFRG